MNNIIIPLKKLRNVGPKKKDLNVRILSWNCTLWKEMGERGRETYNCLNVEIGQAFFLTVEDPSQF